MIIALATRVGTDSEWRGAASWSHIAPHFIHLGADHLLALVGLPPFDGHDLVSFLGPLDLLEARGALVFYGPPGLRSILSPLARHWEKQIK